jgi:hypothetical protein
MIQLVHLLVFNTQCISTFVFLSYEYFCVTATNRLLCLVGLSVRNFALSFILLNKWAGIKRCIA